MQLAIDQLLRPFAFQHRCARACSDDEPPFELRRPFMKRLHSEKPFHLQVASALKQLVYKRAKAYCVGNASAKLMARLCFE